VSSACAVLLTDDRVVSCIKEALPNRDHHSICHPLTFALLFTLLTSGAKVKKTAPFATFLPSKEENQAFEIVVLICVCVPKYQFFFCASE
jgi:hypothetical protein